MKSKLQFTFLLACIGLTVQAQSPEMEKKKSVVSTNQKKDSATNNNLQLPAAQPLPDRSQLKQSDPGTYTSKPQFEVTQKAPRWYALENENNPTYWKNVNLSRMIIQLKKGTSECDIKALLDKYALNKILNRSKYPQKQNYIVVEVPQATKERVLQIIMEAREYKQVEFAEPEAILKSQSCAPNDTYWGNQWGPFVIYADSAWCFTTGNTATLVAVIDDAVDWNHPDLYDNVWYGYDFANNDSDPTPDDTTQQHGTHVTGTVAATLNNGIGIAGMVNDTVYFAKNTDVSGNITTQAVIDALNYISSVPKIRAVNMSFGGASPNAAIETACDNAWNSGTLLIAASGNDGVSPVLYPAGYNSVIAVGSIGTDGSNLYLASYSNFGTDQELCAPGGDGAAGFPILSTLPNNNYGGPDWQGTSMASPHVTGLAALMFAANPSLTNVQARTILQQTAFEMGDPGWDQYFGYGMICAPCAVSAAMGAGNGIATDQLSQENQIRIYPNPNNGRFNILLSQASEQYSEIKIYNVLGKLVSEYSNQTNSLSIDLSDQSNGVYFAHISNSTTSTVKKIVVDL